MDHTQHTKTQHPDPPHPDPPHPTPPAGGMPADLLARLSAAGVSLDDLTQAGLVRPRRLRRAPSRVRWPGRWSSSSVTGPAATRRGRRTCGSWSTASRTCARAPADVLHRTVPLPQRPPRPDCLPPLGEDLDCADRYAGAGSRDIDAVVRSDVSDLAWWTRRRALKRTVARNVKRARAGCRCTRPTAAAPRSPPSRAPAGCSAG